MPRAGLRLKIIAWSFVPTVIILLAVAMASFYAYQRVTEDLVIQRDEELARLSAGQLAAELAQYSDLLASQSRTPGLVSGDLPAQRAALAAAANRLLVFDGGTFLLNTYGQVVASAPARPELAGLDWSGRAYFRQMLRSSKPAFSNILGDGPNGSDVVIVAVPVTDSQGEFLGALCGAFKIGESATGPLYGGIVKLRTREDGRVYLVDGNARAIYHSDSQYTGYDLSRLPAIQPVLSGKLGHLRTNDIHNQEIIASYAPVPGTDWGLVTEQSWQGLLNSSQRYRQLLLILLGLGVVIPVLVVAFGVGRITRPITRLIGAAQDIASGHFNQRIKVGTGDELEDLAEQFNRMAEQLAANYSELEGRVANRTRELAALNSIASVVSRSLDLGEILRSSLGRTLEVMELSAGGIHLLDPAAARLRLAAQAGLQPATAEAIDNLGPGKSFAGLVAESGEPIVTYDVAGDVRLGWPTVTGEDLRSLACVPLWSKGYVVGTLFVATRDYRTFSPQDVELLASIGNQIAVAVDNARLYGQARQLAVMEERTRLARDLHDSVTQSLYGVTLYADAALRLLPAGDLPTAASHVLQVRDTAQEALREMRLLIFELRPPVLQSEGLAAALLARLEAVESRAGLKTEFKVTGEVDLSPEIEDGLYSIAREALNNALKHAQAREVRVLLCHKDGHVILEVADDGMGFAPDSTDDLGGLGLRGMRERACNMGGELQVEAAADHGTVIRAVVPIGDGSSQMHKGVPT